MTCRAGNPQRGSILRIEIIIGDGGQDRHQSLASHR